MLRRAWVFGVVGVCLAVLYTGVVLASKYRRIGNYNVECSPQCGGTLSATSATTAFTTASILAATSSPSIKQTIFIEGVMGLREGPIRINEVSELVVTVLCRNINNGDVTGTVISPDMRILKSVKLSLVVDDGSFDRAGDVATAVLEFNPDDFLTEKQACPGEAFENISKQVEGFHFEDKIVACSKFNKQGVCTTAYVADILAGHCDLVDGTWSCDEEPQFHHN